MESDATACGWLTRHIAKTRHKAGSMKGREFDGGSKGSPFLFRWVVAGLQTLLFPILHTTRAHGCCSIQYTGWLKWACLGYTPADRDQKTPPKAHSSTQARSFANLLKLCLGAIRKCEVRSFANLLKCSLAGVAFKRSRVPFRYQRFQIVHIGKRRAAAIASH